MSESYRDKIAKAMGYDEPPPQPEAAPPLPDDDTKPKLTELIFQGKYDDFWKEYMRMNENRWRGKWIF